MLLDMEIASIRTPGLGDATYLAIHEGHALVVDPQRDIGRFVEALGNATAAVLEQRGFDPIVLVDGGVPDLIGS